MKYLREVRERFRGSPAFTLSDIRVLLGRKGISSGYLHLLLHNLIARGEVRRIARGTFTFSSDSEVVGFGFRPFYYGLQDALSIRNLWEQETNPVVITPRKVRVGLRSFSGGNYLVRRISRNMFFGFEMMKRSGLWVPVSDPEKTLIDVIYFREPLSKESLASLKSSISMKKLSGYLSRCSPLLKKRVLRMLGKLGK